MGCSYGAEYIIYDMDGEFNVDINLDYRTLRLGYNTGFTLTVKAVNDAPIALHPMKELYLSWDVAMVLTSV